jgi:hypothetical protein
VGTVGNFVAGEILQFHQVSTPLVFSVLNLEGFGEGRRVEQPGPEPYSNPYGTLLKFVDPK